jgi:hypothetical protein
MGRDRETEIIALIDRLNKEIDLSHTHSLNQTAHLLEMALLDLKMILHSITEEELQQLVEVLDKSLPKEKYKRTH